MTDYTIASKITTPQIDPIATVTKFNAAQQGLLQNKLLGQNIQQTLAQRAAAQASIDPATGKYDPQRNIAALAQGGASQEAIGAAQQAYTQQLQQKLAEAQIPPAEIASSLAKLGQVGSVAGGLLQNADKAPLTKQNVTDAIDGLYKSGVLQEGDRQYEDAFLQSVGGISDDPKQNAITLRKIYAVTHPNSEGMTFLRGQVSPQDVGSGVAMTQTSGLPTEAGGGTNVPGFIPKSLAPSQLAQTVDVIDPVTKEKRTTTLGALLGQPVGGAPPASGGPKNGRYPGASGGGNQLEAPGGVTTGLAPGTAETMTGSANQYLADQAAVPNLKRTLTTFDQGYQAMKNATTGPASERLQNLRGIADTYGIPLPAGVANKNETVAYAEANKWMTSALTSEAQRLGLGTDAARALQGEAQPGVHTVHDAAMAMIPVLKGLKAMDLVAPVIAQQRGWTPQQYVEKKAQWANSVDPLAFGADLMSAPQRQAIIAGLKTTEARAKFAQGLKDAQAAGLFKISDLAK